MNKHLAAAYTYFHSPYTRFQSFAKTYATAPGLWAGFSGGTFCLFSIPLSCWAPGLCPVAHRVVAGHRSSAGAHLPQEPQGWAAPRPWAAPSLAAACCILPPRGFLLPTEGLQCTLGLKCSLLLAFVACDPRMNSGS